jgi:hypothetical protein
MLSKLSIEESNKIQEQINNDLTIIENNNLNINIIKNFVDKIEKHINSEKKIFIEDISQISKYYKYITKSLHYIEYCVIFNSQIQVYLVYWNENDKCCFNSQIKLKDYGYVDYIFIKNNKPLLVSSLVFHQINKHNFFQNDNYPLDPQNFIDFFNIRNIDYLTKIKNNINSYHKVSKWYIANEEEFEPEYRYEIYNYDKFIIKIYINEDILIEKKSNIFIKCLLKYNIEENFIEFLGSKLNLLEKIKNTCHVIIDKYEIIDKIITDNEKNKNWI